MTRSAGERTDAPPPRRLHLLGLGLAVVIPLVWPGDVPFINDEPQLIANALAASANGQLAPMGLQGTFGFAYGPLPTWMYQAPLALTHDLVVVSALHIALMSVATASALWWLARSLKLWGGFAAVPLLSPYFWFYARVLWDNTLLLPLGALAFAGYAAFLATRSSGGLRLAIAAMCAIPLVHLMGASLIVPLALHMVIVHRHALWMHARSLAAIAVTFAWLAWPYWRYLAGPRPPSPGSERVLDGWLLPLLGARLLGTRELEYFYGPGPVIGSPFVPTSTLSLIAYALTWLGIAAAIGLVVRGVATRAWSARTHLAAIAIASLGVQAVVHGMSAKFEHPHYQNGTWIATVFLAWMAVDWLMRRGPARPYPAVAVTVTLACANIAAVGTLALDLHRTRGTREVYGPTLANQQQVARALARYAPGSEIHNRVVMWDRFPHALATLRQLQAARRLDLPRRRLVLDYASADPRSGAIAVIEGTER